METTKLKESFVKKAVHRLKESKKIILLVGGGALVLGGSFFLGKSVSSSPVETNQATHSTTHSVASENSHDGVVSENVSEDNSSTENSEDGDEVGRAVASEDSHEPATEPAETAHHTESTHHTELTKHAESSDHESTPSTQDGDEEIKISLKDHLKKETPVAHEAEHATDLHRAAPKLENKVAAHTETSDHTKAPEHNQNSEKEIGLLEKFKNAAVSIQDKVESIQQIESELKKIKKENAELRLMLETKKYAYRAEESESHVKEKAEKLKETTGAEVGRILSSINYKIPENLLPEQLEALALSYFKQKDDEKAVIIFSFLTELENNSDYRDSETYLLTAISWYRLQNYKKSEEYLDKILKVNPKKERPKYVAQAKLWKALNAKKQNQSENVNLWINRTLEGHPHSQEAKWINPDVVIRKPAQNETKKEHHEDSNKPSHH